MLGRVLLHRFAPRARRADYAVFVEHLVIASRTGTRLELTPAPRPHDVGTHMPAWLARLVGPGLEAILVCPEAGWEPHSLAHFLQGLDDDWRGWDGERIWQSEEAELRLSARHDKTNTVLMTVNLEDGAPPRWSCWAELELDPGVFRQLAIDAGQLAELSVNLNRSGVE